MTRDYRHGHGQKQAFQRKSQEETQNKERSFGLSIWVVGLVLSVILVLIFFGVKHFLLPEKQAVTSLEQPVPQEAKEIKKTPDTSAEVIVKSAPLKVPEVTVSKEKEGGGNSNHYSFYHGLSQTEVVVEAELISVALTQPYYIQAGSFGSEKIAKQEQRRLAKHGQTLTVSGLTKGSRTYYRLRVGPFKDRLVMNKQRNELRRLGVDTLLIKATK